jgi:hypothetical protein
MSISELINPFLRHCDYMKYATSQQALQRLEQEYLARLSPSQSDEASSRVVEVHNIGALTPHTKSAQIDPRGIGSVRLAANGPTGQL